MIFSTIEPNQAVIKSSDRQQRGKTADYDDAALLDTATEHSVTRVTEQRVNHGAENLEDGKRGSEGGRAH